MGFAPREIDEMALAEFVACVDGWKKANGCEDSQEPMSADRFEQLREQFKG